MKRLLLLVSFFLAAATGKSQELVPNSSFEVFSDLPSDDCDWFLATGWTNAASTSFCNSNNGTPDYYHLYGVGPYSMLPANFFSELLPEDGSAIMGLLGYSNLLPNAREYISIQLTQPLEQGMLYELSFSLTQGIPADDNFSVNGWGACLSVEPLLQQAGTNAPINPPSNQFIVPQVVYSESWQSYSFDFVADSAYSFITLGNFGTDAQLTIQENGNPGFFAFAYVFVDHVSVKAVNPLPVSLISFNAELALNNEGLITWTTASETNNDFFILERSSDGSIWQRVQQIDGAGTSVMSNDYFVIDANPIRDGTFYRLKQVDYNGEISISDLRYLGPLPEQNLPLEIYPNPVQELLNIKLAKYVDLQVEIYNAKGQLVKDLSSSEQRTSGILSWNVADLEPGIYFIRAPHSSASFIKR